MKKTSKILGVILSSVTAISMMSNIYANAEFNIGYVSNDMLVEEHGTAVDPNTPPANCEDIKDTDYYKNHQKFFSYLSPWVYRSTIYTNIFYFYRGFNFDSVYAEIYNEKKELCEEIYNKYKDRLNYDYFAIYDESITGTTEHNYFTVYDHVTYPKIIAENYPDASNQVDYSEPVDLSEYEKAAQEKYDHIEEKYPVIMEMLAEMKSAGCFKNNVTYTPFKPGPLRAFCPMYLETYMYNDNYKGREEELNEIFHQVCDKADCDFTKRDGVFFTDQGAYNRYNEPPNATSAEILETERKIFLDLFNNGGNIEGMFATLDMLRDRSEELGMYYRIINYSYDDDLGGGGNADDSSVKTIDCLAILNSLGDVNIDGRVGIQDIIAMNKSVSDIIVLNGDQITAADMNFDGRVDGNDLDMILRKVVEL